MHAVLRGQRYIAIVGNRIVYHNPSWLSRSDVKLLVAKKTTVAQLAVPFDNLRNQSQSFYGEHARTDVMFSIGCLVLTKDSRTIGLKSSVGRLAVSVRGYSASGSHRDDDTTCVAEGAGRAVARASIAGADIERKSV